jgi:hypothetical protein
VSPEPLPLLETPETGRIRDLVTWIGHLDRRQLMIFAQVMAGRDPDLTESTLRCLPRRCGSCGQIIAWPADSGRPL